MLRTLLGQLSPGAERGRLSILILHRVLPQGDPLFPDEIDAPRFDQICGWVAAWFKVLPLDEAVTRLREGTLPTRALAITFDDGYADNRTVAMPILQWHGLCATFFIATGYLDGGRMWNDTVVETVRRAAGDRLDLRALQIDGLGAFDIKDSAQRRAAINRIIASFKYLPPAERQERVKALARVVHAPLPDQLMMTSRQVREMRAGGMQIGAHTVTHPILARMDGDSARREMLDSKRTLEQLLDAPVELFAYPNGKPGQDYTPRDATIAREIGFTAALSTAWGAAHAGTSPFEIPRFTPWDRRRASFGLRMAGNLWASRP